MVPPLLSPLVWPPPHRLCSYHVGSILAGSPSGRIGSPDGHSGQALDGDDGGALFLSLWRGSPPLVLTRAGESSSLWGRVLIVYMYGYPLSLSCRRKWTKRAANWGALQSKRRMIRQSNGFGRTSQGRVHPSA